MFTQTYSIAGQTGQIGILQFGVTPTFNDIFTGLPQYYPGSSVEVQETVRIITNITAPELIDTDLHWFLPKKYIGSWQVLDTFGSFTWEDSKYGFLNGEVFDISFKSRYTIVANPSTPKALHSQVELSNCSFFLEPAVNTFPGNPLPVAGQGLYPQSPALIGVTSLSPAPLADTEYNQFIGGIGLYLLPGVEGVSIEYKIAVINDIYTDYAEYVPPSCEFSAPSCQQQFDDFIAAGNNRFTSQQPCLLQFVECYPFTWTCPTNSGETFTYWLGISV